MPETIDNSLTVRRDDLFTIVTEKQITIGARRKAISSPSTGTIPTPLETMGPSEGIVTPESPEEFNTDARLIVGGKEVSGSLFVRNAGDQFTLVFNGISSILSVGTKCHPGQINVSRSNGEIGVRIDGEAGDIELHGADCAENFEIADEFHSTDPGTVMVIDPDGRLCPAKRSYDRRVAGIVSGAGAYQPGILLGRTAEGQGHLPIALAGKVFCKADAGYGAIDVGDLLTTSETPGYAMKAVDPQRAFGAVIGKALRPLERGQDLIPVLIALQ